jgi:hypothetical protein
MSEVIEALREVLHEAIDNCNADEILKASVALDEEIVKAMTMFYIPNKIKSS